MWKKQRFKLVVKQSPESPTYLPTFAFNVSSERQKQELPVISTANNEGKEITESSAAPGYPSFFPQQSKQRSPAAETCPGVKKNHIYPVNVTLFGAQNSATRVYSSAGLWFLPPFRSCPLSLSLCRLPLLVSPSGRRCSAVPNSGAEPRGVHSGRVDELAGAGDYVQRWNLISD